MDLSIWHILLIAFFSRAVFVGVPLHSDDYYRFYWDGQLVLHHLNPYVYTPHELMDMDLVPQILEPIFGDLNSPYYHSIYPVTNQCVFAFAAWVGGDSLIKFVLVVRFILLIFEMISVWTIYRILTLMKKSPNYTLLYALNPLVLLEVTGNLHFEGMMVTFMFLGILAFLQQKIITAGSWIGTAIAVKLTPLILLPLILKYLNIHKFLWFISVSVLVCGLFFLPIFLTGTLNNFFTSLQLYYGKFEFNASIYYLLRELGYLIKGYNMIASISMVLSLLVFVLICYTSWKVRICNVRQLIFLSLGAYFIYLVFSMVVHPWYILPLLGLGILGGLKYPLIWSYLVYLSYYAYSVVPYRESYVLIGLQYGILAIFAIAEYIQYLSHQKQRYYKL